MNKNRLAHKIIRLITELHDAVPKDKYSDSKDHDTKSYWVSWIGIDESKEILKKYKAAYVDEGASRMAIEIVHCKQKFVFKLCFTDWSDEVNDPHSEYEDENHLEIMACERYQKNHWTKSLILPMVTFFWNRLVGWVSVWPKAVEYCESLEKDSKYNDDRIGMIMNMTSDNHDSNFGYWGGFVWLFDLNVDDEYHMVDVVAKSHKKSASKNRKEYREMRKRIASLC